jgi:hypothetical protein
MLTFDEENGDVLYAVQYILCAISKSIGPWDTLLTIDLIIITRSDIIANFNRIHLALQCSGHEVVNERNDRVLTLHKY